MGNDANLISHFKDQQLQCILQEIYVKMSLVILNNLPELHIDRLHIIIVVLHKLLKTFHLAFNKNLTGFIQELEFICYYVIFLC
jgi:hypothetical protein